MKIKTVLLLILFLFFTTKICLASSEWIIWKDKEGDLIFKAPLNEQDRETLKNYLFIIGKDGWIKPPYMQVVKDEVYIGFGAKKLIDFVREIKDFKLKILLQKFGNLFVERKERNFFITEQLVLDERELEFKSGTIECYDLCYVGKLLNTKRQTKEIEIRNLKIEFLPGDKAKLIALSPESYIKGTRKAYEFNEIIYDRDYIREIRALTAQLDVEPIQDVVIGVFKINGEKIGGGGLMGFILGKKNGWAELFGTMTGCLFFHKNQVVPKTVAKQIKGKTLIALGSSPSQLCSIEVKGAEIKTFPEANQTELNQLAFLFENFFLGKEIKPEVKKRDTLIKGKNLKIYQLTSLTKIKKYIELLS